MTRARSYRTPYTTHSLFAEAASAAGTRRCDSPGCPEAGDYRAPKSRHSLSEYYWFCLNHVRAYNAQWDYYKGMTPEEIEQEIRFDTIWRRPTWRLGQGAGGKDDSAATGGRDSATRRAGEPRFRDPFGFFGEDGPEMPPPPRGAMSREEAKAFALFGLTPPTSIDAVKARYKSLVKRHHPDRHGGDKQAEEKLKEINEAYATLKAAVQG